MFEEYITRGVAVLDERSPHGEAWVFQVDTDDLDMSDWSQCVLGQLYGGFVNGSNELVEPWTTVTNSLGFAIRHGFELPPDTGKTMSLEEYRQLTDEWRTHICELRFQRAVAATTAKSVQTEE